MMDDIAWTIKRIGTINTIRLIFKGGGIRNFKKEVLTERLRDNIVRNNIILEAEQRAQRYKYQ